MGERRDAFHARCRAADEACECEYHDARRAEMERLRAEVERLTRERGAAEERAEAWREAATREKNRLVVECNAVYARAEKAEATLREAARMAGETANESFQHLHALLMKIIALASAPVAMVAVESVRRNGCPYAHTNWGCAECGAEPGHPCMPAPVAAPQSTVKDDATVRLARFVAIEERRWMEPVVKRLVPREAWKEFLSDMRAQSGEVSRLRAEVERLTRSADVLQRAHTVSLAASVSASTRAETAEAAVARLRAEVEEARSESLALSMAAARGALDQRDDERARAEKAEAALRDALMCIEEVVPGEHSPWCNGVHAGVLCEGEVLMVEFVAKLRALASTPVVAQSTRSEEGQIMSDDREEFEAWKRRRDEDRRKRGAYWLTPEGRAELRETWEGDGDAVPPVLLTELELAESRARAAAPPDVVEALRQGVAGHDGEHRTEPIIEWTDAPAPGGGKEEE